MNPTPHTVGIAAPIPRRPPHLELVKRVLPSWQAPELPSLDFPLLFPLLPGQKEYKLQREGDIILTTPSESKVWVSTQFLEDNAKNLLSSLKLVQIVSGTSTYLWKLDLPLAFLFLTALYNPKDPWYCENTDPKRAEGVMVLCRILWLSTIYGSAILRQSTLLALRHAFPTNFQRFDTMLYGSKFKTLSFDPEVIIAVLNVTEDSGAHALRCSALYCALHVGSSVLSYHSSGSSQSQVTSLNDKDRGLLKRLLDDRYFAKQGRDIMLNVLDHCRRHCDVQGKACWQTYGQSSEYTRLKHRLSTLKWEESLSPLTLWDYVEDIQSTMCGKCTSELKKRMEKAAKDAWESMKESFEPVSQTRAYSSLSPSWEQLEEKEQCYLDALPTQHM
ncbi:hypothetical protein EIP91_005777 [Steccherinum ochraceum]|uniref:Uncharacterized protein n=1 Tax=Steccherinum ochraceum TaxID=92696 RepID=A0A4R0R9B8_9APHY|nr:hypothetical protein EIP91_005777 [Steccherinum ochraceum]